MPLAITLMANTARMTGLGADQLMEEYKSMGTAMLEHGVDAKHSLDVCISLSMDSPPMKKHPDAYGLIATLAMLPVGTTYNGLKRWWAGDLLNLMGPLQVLAETALIERRGTNYFILPVIRSYILDPSRLSGNVRAATIASACNFLNHHNSSPGDPSFKEHAIALSAEEGNLQAIFLEATDPQTSLVEAFLVLARHQLSTRPRLEVIEHALKLVRRMESHRELIGDVLTVYGWILKNLDHYDRAEEQFNLARQTFLSIPDEAKAARCSLNLVEVYIMMTGKFKWKLRLIMDAKSVFEQVGDAQGVALSFYYLGHVKGQHGFHTEGIEFLTRAREMFQDLGDLLNHAKCSSQLQQGYYRAKKYDDALISGRAAVHEYEHLGQYPGGPMKTLGRILFVEGKYSNALETLLPTLAICKSYGRPLEIAQTLEMIGRTWVKMDRQADAKAAYAEAMRYYGTTQVGRAEYGMTRCQFLMQQAENPSLVPTSEERRVLRLRYNDF